MIQTLTREAILEAGRKAYEEKRLSAQGSTPECAYRDLSGCPCVIGAVLTDETVKLIEERHQQSTRISMMPSGIVNFDSYETTQLANELQTRHDNWVRAVALEQEGLIAIRETEFTTSLYGETNADAHA